MSPELNERAVCLRECRIRSCGNLAGIDVDLHTESIVATALEGMIVPVLTQFYYQCLLT